VVQRRRQQRDQHGEAVPVDLGHERCQLRERIAPLVVAAGHQRTEIERHTHVIEACAMQSVKVEQLQRVERMRKRRSGIGSRGAVAFHRGEFKKLDQRGATLEHGQSWVGDWVSDWVSDTWRGAEGRDESGAGEGEPRPPHQDSSAAGRKAEMPRSCRR
jgi:hypothetical protein